MDSTASDCINRRPLPGRAPYIANLKSIWVCIWSAEIYSTADPWTSVGAGVTIRIVGGGAGDETGEDGVDDGVSVCIGAGLEAGIADVGLTLEVKLLGKIVTGSVGGFCDGEGEADVFEARRRGVGYVPRYTDESHG